MARCASDALREAAVQLRQVGIDSPVVDAQLMMAKALNTSRVEVIMHPERELTDAESKAFNEMVEKRAARCPVAYITGVKEFYGIRLVVSEDVLVPRPETELLVDECASRIRRKHCCIADIGTGSGAVALAIAAKLEHARIYATDSSQSALQVAATNIQNQNVADRVIIRDGNLAEPLLDLESQFDAVVSNPPYIPTRRIDLLEPEVRIYEPRQALDGGEDGLDAYRRLLPGAYTLLRNKGFVACEIGQGQSEEVSRIARESGFDQIDIVRDLASIERVVIARK